MILLIQKCQILWGSIFFYVHEVLNKFWASSWSLFGLRKNMTQQHLVHLVVTYHEGPFLWRVNLLAITVASHTSRIHDEGLSQPNSYLSLHLRYLPSWLRYFILLGLCIHEMFLTLMMNNSSTYLNCGQGSSWSYWVTPILTYRCLPNFSLFLDSKFSVNGPLSLESNGKSLIRARDMYRMIKWPFFTSLFLGFYPKSFV